MPPILPYLLLCPMNTHASIIQRVVRRKNTTRAFLLWGFLITAFLTKSVDFVSSHVIVKIVVS